MGVFIQKKLDMNIKLFNKLNLVLLILLGLTLAVFLWRPFWQIGGDGFGYYSYARSIIFDYNFDLHNEFALFDSLYGHHTLANWQTATGQLANPFSVGPAILWSPFVLLAKLLSSIIYFDNPYNLTGYNWPFQAAIAFGTWFYFLLGIIFIYQALIKFFSKPISFLAILGSIAISPAPYYLIYEPSMSHALTVFSTGLFFYFVVKIYQASETKLTDYVFLGLAAGLLFLIRWQDIIFVLLALIIFNRKDSIRSLIKPLALGFFVFLLTILPQFLMWHFLFGSWLAVPQGSSFFDLTHPHFWQFLFSSYHGMFIVHPMLILAIIGLILAIKKHQKIVVVFLAALILQIYLNAGLADWYGGGSFGARRMVSSFFIFSFGLAALFENWHNKKILIRITALLILLALVFNGLLMMAYAKEIIPLDKFTSYSEFYSAPIKVLENL